MICLDGLICNAPVAQWTRRLTTDQEIESSILSGGRTFLGPKRRPWRPPSQDQGRAWMPSVQALGALDPLRIWSMPPRASTSGAGPPYALIHASRYNTPGAPDSPPQVRGRAWIPSVQASGECDGPGIRSMPPYTAWAAPHRAAARVRRRRKRECEMYSVSDTPHPNCDEFC
jgi:hypothetical protein